MGMVLAASLLGIIVHVQQTMIMPPSPGHDEAENAPTPFELVGSVSV